MNTWEKLDRIIAAQKRSFPAPMVGVRAEGPMYRASLVGVFIDGKAVETACRPTPGDAIDLLYEMLLEMAWKRFRPIQGEMRDLGFVVPEPEPLQDKSTE